MRNMNMQKIGVFLLGLFLPTVVIIAQETSVDSVIAKNIAKKVDLSKRANDHFVVQLGYIYWTGAQDLEKPANKFNREVNIAFMYDIPFKSNPNFSFALGAGYSAGNVFFDKTYLGLKDAPVDGRLSFQDLSKSNYFKKYKLLTQYVEAPLEIRYATNAEKPAKGFRVAAGLKLGYLMDVRSKGKNYVSATNNDASVYSADYRMIEVAGKNYVSPYRYTATLRVGYDMVNIFATYQLNTIFKEGSTQNNIRPFSIGLALGIL